MNNNEEKENNIEIWKPYLHDGNKTIYQVSNYGNVTGMKGLLRLRKKSDRYLESKLSINKKSIAFYVHKSTMDL
jgi:hypothetical protein